MLINIQLNRRAGQRTLATVTAALAFVALLSSAKKAALAETVDQTYQLVTEDSSTHSFKVAIGITSLIKIEIMPKTGIDLQAVPTSGLNESFSLLEASQAHFALLSNAWDAPATHSVFDQLQAVATLWNEEDRSAQLVVRRDVDAEAVYEITRAIFERLDFLRNVDGIIEEASLDTALSGISLPLHEGARRYYEEKAVLPRLTDEPEIQQAEREETVPPVPAPAPTPAPAPAATVEQSVAPVEEAKTFTVYFDFDQATIDDQGQAVLDELERFASNLDGASIWVAGYTDTAGDADYNLRLAERRANAVLTELQSRQISAQEMDVTALGERSPWIVTADQTYEARNRRVEILIEPFRDPIAVGQTNDGVNESDGATERRIRPTF